MDQRKSNHRNGGRSQHLHNAGLDRGRQHDNHGGGDRNGWNDSGRTNNTREREGNYDRHGNFQVSQGQHQQQQRQGEREGHARKRSRSPSNPHHNDPQQQQRNSNNPNKYYPPKSPHHDNRNNIMPYREREGSVIGCPPPNNAPQSLLLSPPPSSKQPQSPPVTAAATADAALVAPHEKRRTLILSNIPSHIQFYHLQNFFRTNWNAPVQYCVVDRQASEAYVVFKSVQDAQRVWMEGRRHHHGKEENNRSGIDGNGGSSGGGPNGVKSLENTDNFVSSLVELGVELRAIHFSNHVNLLDLESITRRGGDNIQGECTNYNSGNESGSGGRLGGEGASHNDRRRSDSLCRSVRHGQHSYHGRSLDVNSSSSELPQCANDQYAIDSRHHQQHVHYNAQPEPSHVSPASACIQTTNNTNYYPRTPIPLINKQQKNQSSAIELQLKQQEEAEEWGKWEAFQLEEMEWRKRRRVEYNSFIQAKNERSTQLSTLEQKRDLLSKQEHMLSQQLPLYKKILVMLKSKNATPSEQSTKMKEILSTSKRIVELKTEMKGITRDIEKIKEEESVLGVFRPSEKRPVFSGNVGGTDAKVGSGKKRSLDRRTTTLKVQGFDESDKANEDTIMKRFSTFGTIISVRLENRNGDSTGCGGNDEALPLVALINYENRIDAERAKSEISINGSLTCTWHNPSASTGSAAKSDGLSPVGRDHVPEVDGYDEDHGLYDDYNDGEDNGDQFSMNENVGCDYDEDEGFVDYD